MSAGQNGIYLQTWVAVGDKTLRVATIILAVLLGAGSALAEWQDATTTDFGGKKIVMQRNSRYGCDLEIRPRRQRKSVSALR